MRIAVTGRKGQVVRSLLDRASISDHQVVAVGRPGLDLTADARSIIEAIAAARPDCIVSAAAYTAVDQAESEVDLAFAINDAGAEKIARAAATLGIPLIHLSTDYVFDGSKALPYKEEDLARPINVYGASKLAGEQSVLSAHPNSAVLRTGWVYSPFGTNFVKTMLQLAQRRDQVSVVADQIGSPTSALDIADSILEVASNLSASMDPNLRGIFHMTSPGSASWADLAEATYEVAKSLVSAEVKRVTSSQYQTIAKRPANSRLDCAKLAGTHGLRLPDWRSSLNQVVERLIREPTDMKEAAR